MANKKALLPDAEGSPILMSNGDAKILAKTKNSLIEEEALEYAIHLMIQVLQHAHQEAKQDEVQIGMRKFTKSSTLTLMDVKPAVTFGQVNLG